LLNDFAGALATGYVVDNLLDKISALSSAASIVSCVNATYALWQRFNQHASAGATLLTALRTIPAFQDLAKEVREDRAEELATASAKDLTGDALELDLDKVADPRTRATGRLGSRICPR
jgi:hypothetical protein